MVQERVLFCYLKLLVEKKRKGNERHKQFTQMSRRTIIFGLVFGRVVKSRKHIFYGGRDYHFGQLTTEACKT